MIRWIVQERLKFLIAGQAARDIERNTAEEGAVVAHGRWWDTEFAKISEHVIVDKIFGGRNQSYRCTLRHRSLEDRDVALVADHDRYLARDIENPNQT